jgi:hypothetical protein
MLRYSPEEYLVATVEAVEDNGLRRIGWLADNGGGRATELSMTSFFGFLKDGKTGTVSREPGSKEGKGWEEETSDEALNVSESEVKEVMEGLRCSRIGCWWAMEAIL